MLVKKGQSHDCYLEEEEAILGSLEACVFVCFFCVSVCVCMCVHAHVGIFKVMFRLLLWGI